MKLLLVISITLFLGGLAAADSLSALNIQPTFSPVVKKIGENALLTCNYRVDVISNVGWHDQDGNQIVSGADPRKSVDATTSRGEAVLEITDLMESDNGIYRCKGTKQEGNVTVVVEVTKELSVTEDVVIIDTDKRQEFLYGDTISVVCNAMGIPKPTITWHRRDKEDETKYNYIDTSKGEKYAAIEGSDNLVIRNISKDDEGVYKCNARQKPIAQSNYEYITVIVNIAPKIENWVLIQKATEGIQTVLNCLASGDPEPSYRWYKGNSSNVDISSALSMESALELNVTRDMTGQLYTCVAENNGGRDMATVALNVFVKPYFNISEGDVTEELNGAEIRCVADGIPTPEVVMFRDDIPLAQTIRDQVPKLSDADAMPMSGWSSNRRVDYNGNEVVVQFLSTRPEDKGIYECRATSLAGIESVDVFLDVKYSPRPGTFYNEWACNEKDSIAQLDCTFDANPPAELSWGRYLPVEGSNDIENDTSVMNFTESDHPEGMSLVKTGDILSLVIEVGVVQDPWGDYICYGKNEVGSVSATSKLSTAEPPQAPINVNVSNVKTREATISFSVLPPVVPYSMFSIKLFPASRNATTVSENLHGIEEQESYEHTFFDLDHNTQYTVIVESINCVDKSEPSDPKQFMTQAIEKPESVQIISGKASEDHDKYTVRWRTGDLGGGEISEIRITLYKVEQTIDGTNLTKLNDFSVPPDKLDQENGSFTIESLDPVTKYEISVDIYNEVGSATARRKFLTQMRPEVTTTAKEIDESQVAAGGLDTMLIGIIVAVLFLLIVIVDITCCCTRSWGLSYWIYAHTCGKGEKHTVNDVEEGGKSSSRQNGDSEGDGSNCHVEEEKQMLNDQPLANGDPDLVKLDPIDEQAPLQNEDASSPVASGNGSAEGAKEQGSEEPKEKNDHKSPEEENLVAKDEQ